MFEPDHTFAFQVVSPQPDAAENATVNVSLGFTELRFDTFRCPGWLVSMPTLDVMSTPFSLTVIPACGSMDQLARSTNRSTEPKVALDCFGLVLLNVASRF